MTTCGRGESAAIARRSGGLGLSRSRGDWSRWRALEPADRRLLIEAGVLLTVAEAALKVLPFRHTAALFGLRPNRSLVPDPAGLRAGPASAATTRSTWAVAVAADRAPFGAKCLAQALAGSAMLRRRRVASTIHLGVAKDPRRTDGLRAHAWLRSGDAVVLGASGSKHFTPVAALDVRPRRTPAELVESRLAVERRRPAARRGLMLQRELVRTLQALTRAGIFEVVVLKGVPLAVRVFGSVGEREMRDIDLLVRRRDADGAFATLSALGYEPYLGLPPDFKGHHALTFVRPGSPGSVSVDLHWTAFHRGFGVGEDVQWRHTERFSYQGLDCLVFDRPMTILHLAHHHVVDLSPKVLRDFGVAWNLWHGEVDHTALLALARSTGQLDTLAVAFGRAREAGLLDTPSPIRTPRASVVLRLQGGPLGKSEHGRAMITALAMRPLEGARTTARAVFPPPASMRAIYGDSTAAELARRYVTRPFELAANAARATRA